MKRYILQHRLISLACLAVLVLATISLVWVFSDHKDTPVASAASGSPNPIALNNKMDTPRGDNRNAPNQDRPYTSNDNISTTRSAPKPRVLLDIGGGGSSQTQKFATNGDWSIKYTFDCAQFGTQGNFQYYIYNDDGSMSPDIGANDLAASGGSTNYYYDSGVHYLTVNSECSWHITVTG